MAIKKNGSTEPSRKSLTQRLAQIQDCWRRDAENETGVKQKLLLFAASPAALPVAAVLVLLALLSIVGVIVLAAGGGQQPGAPSSSVPVSADSEWVEPEEDKHYDASQGVIDTNI